MPIMDLTQRESEVLRLVIADYERRISDDDDDSEPEPLSEREREVLILLASGRSYIQIATYCTIELPTVKSHVASILRKMGGARNARAAILIAFRARIITPEEVEPVI